MVNKQFTDAEAFWNREVVEKTHVEWMTDWPIRHHLNAMIGTPEHPLWPIEWLEEWLGGRRFGRALSVGCGTGPLERQLIQRGVCREIEAFDGSIGSLRIARQTADEEGVGEHIRYFAMDFNEPVLPRDRYDIVFFHQSAHHVAKLEKLYRAVLLALKPDGLVYLDEYVGPSRFDWEDERRLDRHQTFYRSLPRRVRTAERLEPPIHVYDPSEAFRSSEIESQLSVGFETLARRPYGGNVLSVVTAYIEPDALDEVRSQLIDEENRWLAGGDPAYYAIVVARPKQGLAKRIASAHYWAVPKIKRVGREIRGLFVPRKKTDEEDQLPDGSNSRQR